MSRRLAWNWKKSRRNSVPIRRCSAIQYDILSQAGNWDAAAEIAGTLTRLEPQEPGTWISLAYATRRKTGGGIPQARAILIQAQRTFPGEQIIAYNLACYDCQLGDLNAARMWLEKSCVLGDARRMKQMARQDLDLEPLWPELCGNLSGNDVPCHFS